MGDLWGEILNAITDRAPSGKSDLAQIRAAVGEVLAAFDERGVLEEAIMDPPVLVDLVTTFVATRTGMTPAKQFQQMKEES